MENTAGSAKKVREDGDITQASIASRQAGELYGLKVLAENICSNDKNATRFVIVSKKPRMQIRSVFSLNCIMKAERFIICFLILFITD